MDNQAQQEGVYPQLGTVGLAPPHMGELHQTMELVHKAESSLKTAVELLLERLYPICKPVNQGHLDQNKTTDPVLGQNSALTEELAAHGVRLTQLAAEVNKVLDRLEI